MFFFHMFSIIGPEKVPHPFYYNNSIELDFIITGIPLELKATQRLTFSFATSFILSALSPMYRLRNL